MADSRHSFNDKVCCSGGKEKVWKFNQISFLLINLNEFFVLFLGIFRAKKTEEVVKIEGWWSMKTFLEKEEMKSDELINIMDFCVILRRKMILNVSFDIKLTEYSLGNTQRLSIGYTVAMRDWF